MLKFMKSIGWISMLSISFIQSHADTERLQYNLVEGLPDIFITPYTEQIGHTWQHGRVWDKPLIRKFYSSLKTHDGFFVMLDLGAQTGSFSLLAKYFPNSQWYAFEPIYEAADTLKANLSLNNIQNVQVIQMAASDSEGSSTLKMPEMGLFGLATMGSNVLRFTVEGERQIECIKLDTFIEVNAIKKVHFMKLDTEGWELNILKGARNLILRDHPIILMEFNETNMKQCQILREEVEQFLNEMGYKWELVSSEDILCTPAF